jgi:hypothetical protein
MVGVGLGRRRSRSVVQPVRLSANSKKQIQRAQGK